MKRVNRFAMHTLGCKVNQYESEKIIAQLKAIGWDLVPFLSPEADAHIINTCTVTSVANHKSRQLIRRASAANPGGIVVVTGCYAESDKAEIEAIDGVDLIAGNKEKQVLASMIADCLDGKKKSTSRAVTGLVGEGEGEDPPHENRHVTARTRALIKVQDGCVNFCTYCIVPHVRGELQYKPVDEVVEEVSASLLAGAQEIVLTGIHLGLYGRQSGSVSALSGNVALTSRLPDGGMTDNRAPGSLEYDSLPSESHSPGSRVSLDHLIKRLIEIPGMGRIRLSSIELNEVTPELVEIMSSSDKLCNHLHIPLQSGSDSILKRMNRHYTAANFVERIIRLKSSIEDLAVTTDVIVGFPGESESDFMQTYEVVKAAGFSKLHVFKYSPRKGTPAAKFDGQIPNKIKDERSAALIDLGKRLSESYASQYLGKNLDVLIERDLGDFLSGVSGNYIRVQCVNTSTSTNMDTNADTGTSMGPDSTTSVGIDADAEANAGNCASANTRTNTGSAISKGIGTDSAVGKIVRVSIDDQNGEKLSGRVIAVRCGQCR